MNDNVESQVRLVIATVGARFVDIPAEGYLLRDMPGYDPELSYMVGNQKVDPDFRVMPGHGQVFASQPHSNG